MSVARTAALSLVLVAAAAGLVSALALRVVPRARDAGQRDGINRQELEQLKIRMAASDPLLDEKARAEGARSDKLAGEARAFADRLQRAEAILSMDEEHLLAELSSRTGQGIPSLRPLLPPPSSSAQESAFRLTTTADLALAAADAGVRELVFILFPAEPETQAASRFGPWLPTRPVKMEYRATPEAHRAFLAGLMRRRERGPYYTLDSCDVRGADPGIVVAQVSLRRIRPSPGVGR